MLNHAASLSFGGTGTAATKGKFEPCGLCIGKSKSNLEVPVLEQLKIKGSGSRLGL
jgi:hypothetical protein